MSPDELPPGWKEHVKITKGRKIKYYTNEEAGVKFYSRKRVIDFVNSKYACQGTFQSASVVNQKSGYSKSDATPIVVEKNASLEWLPRGWIIESRTRKSGSNVGAIYKTYIDPSTGCKFHSKPQVIRYLESVNCNPLSEKQKKEVSEDKASKQDAPQLKDKSMISGKEKNGMGNPSLDNISCGVDKSNVLDELPPGWIKEIRPRKSQERRKDPYYIDPVSGYEFRSKKDVLRYLETGDISRCSIKPKKSSRSDLKLVENVVSAQTDEKILEQSSSRRQLFVGEKPEKDNGSLPRSVVAATEAERSRTTEGDNNSANSKISTSVVEAVENMQLCSEEIECDRLWEITQLKTECFKLDTKVVGGNQVVSDNATAVLHKQEQPEAERLKETQSNNISADSKVATPRVDVSEKHQLGLELIKLDRLADSSQPKTEGSNTTTAILNEKKQTKDVLDTTTNIHLKRCKKRKPLSMPARSSKRLSGQQPEMLPNFGLSERALRAAVRKLGHTEAYMLSNLDQNAADDGKAQQIDTKPQREFITESKLASLETEMQNSFEKPSENQAVEEQAVGQANERQDEENPGSQDAQLWYPFGDTLSDPCYEFAFKTLTGEIPFEDALTFHSCLQPQIETTYTQGGVYFRMPETDTPSLFQNDVPYHFDTVKQNTSSEQLPTNSTTPPGNVNLPSCSSFGSQQPSLEARNKDCETKVNS